METSFLTLKKELVTAPARVLPQEGKPFVVTCDASDVGVGATLEQGGNLVEAISHGFTETEERWPAREKEAFALIFALRRWRHRLLGHNFTLRTDLWSANTVADALLRVKIAALDVKDEDWREVTLSNDQLKEFMGKDGFALKDGYMFQETKAGTKVVVPCSMIPSVLRAYHSDPTGGHLGFAKVLGRISDRYTWKDDWLQYLQTCAFTYRSSRHASSGYSPFELLRCRIPRLGIDVAPPRTLSEGEVIQEMKQYSERVRGEARKSLGRAADRMKEQYDGHHKVTPSQIVMGQRVYWKRPAPVGKGGSRKLHPLFQGPFEVIKILGPKTVTLKGRIGQSTASTDQLKPAQGPSSITLADLRGRGRPKKKNTG
ncbi:hypothetical protein TCAL_14986 [Tigriopus californicus]|uniref:RNA-directed DNA polymerase n=1 Tax=Tigriopus californicus TaxID=6832 RepID=A0A553N9F3_TIGCA|nr:hypothetical protein TCAL_14986 [Tigriopus californicus]